MNKSLTRRQAIALATAALVAGNAHGATAREPRKLADIPFDGRRAFKYLEQLCEIGPRPSGSAGMLQQQKLIEAHFAALETKVTRQEFEIRHPLKNEKVPIVNLIVPYRPQAESRIILCAHYDTRPYPDQDARNPQGTFIGANDGASGTALLMEVGNQMSKIETGYGVDLVFFDAEELVYDFGGRQRGDYFVGSSYFAREYRQQQEQQAGRYRWGVLVDMVADKQLNVHYEGNSYQWRDTRPLVQEIWGIARRLGLREFVPKVKYTVRDDHVPLHDVGKIPCIDIIDYDYISRFRSYWHTEQDTVDKCSAESLEKVGKVVVEWLSTVK